MTREYYGCNKVIVEVTITELNDEGDVTWQWEEIGSIKTQDPGPWPFKYLVRNLAETLSGKAADEYNESTGQ